MRVLSSGFSGFLPRAMHELKLLLGGERPGYFASSRVCTPDPALGVALGDVSGSAALRNHTAATTKVFCLLKLTDAHYLLIS